MSSKEELIREILDRELDMFVNVRSRYPVSCQQNPEAFRLHRGAQFSAWSEETLSSYRQDLLEAAARGDNLMTLKYARMEGIIPPLNESPVIEEIADMELAFQREVHERYPVVLSGGRPLTDDGSGKTSFVTYLKGELETYSDRTLDLLRRDIAACRDGGRNWTEEIYDRLMQRMGFSSLADAEKSLAKRRRVR